MADYARKQNIPELWAGNYGALTEEIQHHFDRVFIGYSEDAIAQLFGKHISNNEIIHPPLISNTSFHGFKLNCQGYLFTNRGCNNKCDFCQTPPFCPKPSKIPLHSIERVLQYYKKLGLTEIIILDESFGLYRKHAEKVVDLLDKYGFYWFPMIRADYLKKRIHDWSKKGLIGALTGIESFNQQILDNLGKNETIEGLYDSAAGEGGRRIEGTCTDAVHPDTDDDQGVDHAAFGSGADERNTHIWWRSGRGNTRPRRTPNSRR